MKCVANLLKSNNVRMLQRSVINNLPLDIFIYLQKAIQDDSAIKQIKLLSTAEVALHEDRRQAEKRGETLQLEASILEVKHPI